MILAEAAQRPRPRPGITLKDETPQNELESNPSLAGPDR
jgi:hypothetical protein